jgi:hypothetical protein
MDDFNYDFNYNFNHDSDQDSDYNFGHDPDHDFDHDQDLALSGIEIHNENSGELASAEASRTNRPDPAENIGRNQGCTSFLRTAIGRG